MLVQANKEELLTLAKSFYDVSHTLLAVYDPNKEVICAYPDKMCQFCSEVRKSPSLTEKCIECDNRALEKCSETHAPYAYKCHMGLLEVAAPIMQNDLVIGYMLFGQITDDKDKSPLLVGLEQKAALHGLDFPTLEEGIQKIRYRSPAYIASISKLVEMCTAYIWQNSLLSVKNDTTAYVIETYIRDHLNLPLTTEVLCKRFHLSRSSLYAISKQCFGCGISEYVARCRIERAKELLTEEKKSVQEVANLLGMDNVSYFIRFFKKQTGLTPKKYQVFAEK